MSRLRNPLSARRRPPRSRHGPGGPSRAPSQSKGTLASKLGAPAWLFNPFRSQPSEPQTTQVSASAAPRPQPEASRSEKSLAQAQASSPIRMPGPAKATVAASSQQIQPVAIKGTVTHPRSCTLEDKTLMPQRASYIRRSPINTPPRDDHMGSKRRSGGSGLAHSFPSSSSPPVALVTPTRPQGRVAYAHASIVRRWQHIYP